MESARAGKPSRFVQKLGFVLGWTLFVVATGCGSELAEEFDNGVDAQGEGGHCAGGSCTWTTGRPVDEIAEKPILQGNEQTSILAPASNTLACFSNAQCASGFCVDGVCCNNKCDNKCMACTAAKKGSGVDGICGSIQHDTDPDNECSNGTCDGQNMCRFYDGNACSSMAQCLSNHCVDGVCCESQCMGACEACSAAKKGSGSDGTCGSIAAGTNPDNECVGGACNGSGACSTAQTKVANAATCSSAAQCASGFCVDGVCCDAECSGTCEACSAAKKGNGSDGTCGPITYNDDPDEECWAGGCDGKGQCKYYNGVPCGTTGECLSNYCADGFCCGNICNQDCFACSNSKKGFGYDGVCEPIAAGLNPDAECTNAVCDGTGACIVQVGDGSTCTTNSQCSSGFCVDGFCCESECTGECVSCSAAKKGSGANGVCGPIAYDIDPDEECWGGGCNGKGQCKYYNGVPCTTTDQCLSNYCADGYCCGNICTQTCYACSNDKKGYGFNGVCEPITTLTDPDNECSNGSCDGAGVCSVNGGP